jgi:Domain of Unknown Function (DUF1080)
MRVFSYRSRLCFASLSQMGSFAFLLMAFVLPVAAQDSAPKAVRNDFKNVVAPDDKLEDWQPLFNGSDLSNWIQRNGWAVYRIEGDSIVGTTSEGSPNSFLCTREEYGDYELRFEVKVAPELNSGVQFRSKSLPDRDNGRVHGPQVEICAAPGPAGYIYGESTGRNWLSPDQTVNDAFKNGEWNQYRIRAQGPRLQTWVNGRLIEDITDTASPTAGFIGLQVHGIASKAGPYQVRWRNIAIRTLIK